MVSLLSLYRLSQSRIADRAIELLPEYGISHFLAAASRMRFSRPLLSVSLTLRSPEITPKSEHRYFLLFLLRHPKNLLGEVLGNSTESGAPA